MKSIKAKIVMIKCKIQHEGLPNYYKRSQEIELKVN